jgi:hypothetical protein
LAAWKIDLRIVDSKGKTLARATNQAPNDAARLWHRRKYNPGDKIVVHGPKHMLFGPGAGMPAGLVASSNTTRRDNRTEQVGAQFSIAEPLNRGKITESDAWTHVWQRTTVYCKNT